MRTDLQTRLLDSTKPLDETLTENVLSAKKKLKWPTLLNPFYLPSIPQKVAKIFQPTVLPTDIARNTLPARYNNTQSLGECNRHIEWINERKSEKGSLIPLLCLPGKGYCFGILQNIWVHYFSLSADQKSLKNLLDIESKYHQGTIFEAVAAHCVAISMSANSAKIIGNHALEVATWFDASFDSQIVMTMPKIGTSKEISTIWRRVVVKKFLQECESADSKDFFSAEEARAIRLCLCEIDENYAKLESSLLLSSLSAQTESDFVHCYLAIKLKVDPLLTFQEHFNQQLEKKSALGGKRNQLFEKVLPCFNFLINYLSSAEAHCEAMPALAFIFNQLVPQTILNRLNFNVRGLDLLPVEEFNYLTVQSNERFFTQLATVLPGSYNITFQTGTTSHIIGYQKYENGVGLLLDANFECMHLLADFSDHEAAILGVLECYPSPDPAYQLNGHGLGLCRVALLDEINV